MVGELTLHRYSQTVSQVVQLGNQYIDVQAPWALRKTDPERMATVLWVLLEALRHVGLASNPNPNPNPNPYPAPAPDPDPNPNHNPNPN